MSHPIRLITLDLDDTLWPCRPTVDAAEAAHFAWLVEQLPALGADHTIESVREHRYQLAENRPDIAHDFTILRHSALTELLADYGGTPALVERAMSIFRDARNRVSPYPEVAEVLARLKQRFILVALTNGNAQVEKTPLKESFHFTITAADAGAAKPDPAMFKMAMQRSQIRASETIHVGDHPEYDIEAARQIGISPVWINRQQLPWPEQLSPPSAQFSDLLALEQWLMERS